MHVNFSIEYLIFDILIIQYLDTKQRRPSECGKALFNIYGIKVDNTMHCHTDTDHTYFIHVIRIYAIIISYGEFIPGLLMCLIV